MREKSSDFIRVQTADMCEQRTCASGECAQAENVHKQEMCASKEHVQTENVCR